MNCPHCKNKITGLIGNRLMSENVVLVGDSDKEAYLTLKNSGFYSVGDMSYFCGGCGKFLTNNPKKALYLMKVINGIKEDTNEDFLLMGGEKPKYKYHQQFPIFFFSFSFILLLILFYFIITFVYK